MAKKTMKGKFITFEGCEGSGKSTHSKMLEKYLTKKGFTVLPIREPGGTRISEELRKVLLNPANKSMDRMVELVLYLSARKQLIEEVIKPALKKGKIVLCDRFHDATIVYQGYALGIDLKVIENLKKLIGISIKPDLTILLDIDIKKGLKRAGKVRDRLELRPHSYHKKVRKGYLLLAKKEPRRIKVVSMDSDIKSIQNKIEDMVDRCL